METNEKKDVIEIEANVSDESKYSAENIEPEEFDEELDLGEEIDSESEVSVVKNYSLLSKKELFDELKLLIENAPIERIRRDVEAIKKAFNTVIQHERAAQEDIELEDGEEFDYVDPVEQEFRACLTRYREKRTEYLKNSEEQKKDNYKRKLAIIDELKDLINEEENLNLTFQKFHNIQNRWKEIGQVPQNQIKTLWDTWHYNVEKFYDYVKINKELRDLDFRRNMEAKIALVKRAEALLESTSVSEAFAQLQTYHDEWREIGPVPRETREELWDRFREITSKVYRKYQSYFEQMKAERALNLQMKADLCERVEKINKAAYKSIKAWQKASVELLSILEEWKTIGFVPKKENAEIYARLKKARDEFFSKRREFYRTLKKDVSNNLRIKKELCEKAEAIKNSDDWKEATETFIELQKQWKQTGSVTRKYSDILWKRFSEACDTFFNRKAEIFQSNEEYNNNLKEKEAIITELEQFEDKSLSIDAISHFRKRWNNIGFVPIKTKNKIQKRFFTLLDEKFNGITNERINRNDDDEKGYRNRDRERGYRNDDRNERKERNYRNDDRERGYRNDERSSRNNDERGSRPKYKREKPQKSERERLISKIAQLENEIALLENNVGFFANTKNAESLIADVLKRIEKAKGEIVEIEEQIKQIDIENNTELE